MCAVAARGPVAPDGAKNFKGAQDYKYDNPPERKNFAARILLEKQEVAHLLHGAAEPQPILRKGSLQ